MINILRIHSLQCQYLKFFLAIYDVKLNLFGFWMLGYELNYQGNSFDNEIKYLASKALLQNPLQPEPQYEDRKRPLHTTLLINNSCDTVVVAAQAVR